MCAGKKAIWEITFLPESIHEQANLSKKHDGPHALEENNCEPDVGQG
jgi:hypothetical protein